MYTRSPQRMGEACARPGTGVRQRMFSFFSMSQRTAAGEEASTPPACTPRNCGQSAAETEPPKNKPSQSVRHFIMDEVRKGLDAGEVNEFSRMRNDLTRRFRVR